jgi:hypothetical protein
VATSTLAKTPNSHQSFARTEQPFEARVYAKSRLRSAYLQPGTRNITGASQSQPRTEPSPAIRASVVRLGNAPS